VVEGLFTSSNRIRAWVDYPYLSDHTPICLQMGENRIGAAYPFKFNPAWIHEASYDTMVREIWNDLSNQNLDGTRDRLISKLNCLRLHSKTWLREKQNGEKEEMNSI